MDASATPQQTAPTIEVDGRWLRDALVTGINKVIAHRDHLNRINVFPVADGDTGTNLALTLHAILVESTGREQPHAGEFLETVADQALDGARGNSGAIMAQYLQGFYEAVADHETLTGAQYAAAAAAGARAARVAVAEPREGTMLSVIHDYAAALKKHSAAGLDDFPGLLAAGVAAARESLARTPEQLEVLAESGVVDAGAQGFVDLLIGMQEYVETGSVTNVLPLGLQLEDDAPVVTYSPNEATHRYCTECMVTGSDLDRRQLHDQITNRGCSSLVLAGTREKLRVHVHTDHPDEVFEICARFGEVSSQKADDMDRQVDSVAAGASSALVVDSGADIPDQMLEQLRIHLVPLRVNVHDAQYIDKVSLNAHQFYRLLDESGDYPTTSQPPPSDFRRQFEFLASHVNTVLCISLSGALSGTWQAASAAAKRVDAKRVMIWDSGSVSAGQGLLAIFAGEALAAGHSPEKTIQMLELMRPRTCAYSAIGDLSYAVRGGRVRAGVGKMADFFHLTPVLSTRKDGTVGPAGVLLGRSEVNHRFSRWLVRRMRPDVRYRVLIADCDAPAAAKAMHDALLASGREIESIHMARAGAALGAHAGPGHLVVGLQQYLSVEDARAAVKQAKESGS